ncbi:hypothetical protein GO594_27735 [Pseudomonas otitidis]|uniref:Uncharacterized protein n=1 Tax=Metapseudomonas otitidis TaxID=319939 RepID=A0A7X3KWG3_9GAMM|nr:hypothetical protein [Pseudomonas otitidis]MWK59795.1 hypothetical protein [Pseudomonas otitidis]
MRNNWVVWLGCICLFLTGVIWGAIPFSKKFFVPNDLHDFLEMLASIATIVAVIVAANGINTWRTQVARTTDHDIAREALALLYQYRDQIAAARSPMMFGHEMEPDPGEPKDKVEGSRVGQIRGYNRRMKRVIEARQALYKLIIHCEVLWGREVGLLFEKVFKMELELVEAMQKHFDPSYLGVLFEGSEEARRTEMIKNRRVLYAGGSEDEFTKDFELCLGSVETYLKKRIISSSDIL